MVTHLNPECIPDGAITASKLVMDSIVTESSANPVQSGAVKAALDTKVDAVSGKGLSTNDYTDADKAKVAAALTEHQSFAGYAKTSDLATVATSGKYSDLTGTPAIPTVPTKVSAFTNDSGYQTASDVQTLINNAVTTALNTEV